MKVEQVIAKYELLSRVLLKNGSDELPKDLKLKIVSARIEYGKIDRAYKADFDEFANTLKTPDFLELANKENKSEEDITKLKPMIDEINESYGKYVGKRVSEDAEVTDVVFTQEEMNEIALVNIDNDVVINNIQMTSADFIENIGMIFC